MYFRIPIIKRVRKYEMMRVNHLSAIWNEQILLKNEILWYIHL